MSAAELTVQKVVLYKHGVGYFERGGEIPSGESAVLQFKASEMDDVLKSLTIEQRGGQGVSAVRYDSSDPLSKRLEVFPFRLEGQMSLARVLDQFKGAEILLTIGTQTVQGAIVSARTLPATDSQPEREELLLLADGALRTVDPGSASSVRFTDEKIQSQFTDYLGVLSRSRNTDRRTVTIESQGGAARVAAGYITPTPIWKSSYRLVFGEGDRPLLEGWAIVDNTSGEDWDGVRLSLVSGLPVSFITRLYEPRYLQRPVIQLAQDRAWTPTVHGGAIEEMEGGRGGVIGGIVGGVPAPPPPAPAALQKAAESRAFRQDVAAAEPMMEMADRSFRNEMSSNIAATAVKAELGELFEYAIDHPVTIRKSESAMLPFFREPVDARRLYIYDESNGSEHPLTAAEITNTSGATLDGGAITVYDAGAYAGEALVETVKAGDKRLISYAVDLGTRITTAFDSTQKLQSEFHVRRGIMTTKTLLRQEKTFTIRNVDPRAKTLIIEHPVRGGFELVDAKPAEKTSSAYRFEVPVGADATVKFPVIEERVYEQSHAIRNMSYDVLISWVRNTELSQAGRDQLARIADVQRQIAEAERENQRLDERIRELAEDQNRLRSNIGSLRSVSGQDTQVQQYAEQLARQEAQIVSVRDEQAQTRRRIDQLQGELNGLIETLEF